MFFLAVSGLPSIIVLLSNRCGNNTCEEFGELEQRPASSVERNLSCSAALQHDFPKIHTVTPLYASCLSGQMTTYYLRLEAKAAVLRCETAPRSYRLHYC